MTKLFNNKSQKQDSDDNNNTKESINNVDNLSKLFGKDVANALSIFLNMNSKT